MVEMDTTKTPNSDAFNKHELRLLMAKLSAEDSLSASKQIYDNFLDSAIKVFRPEAAVFDVTSDKAIIVGDLHGDTDTFRKITTAFSPEKYTYILAGDYVDRGNKCMELLALLLANKLTYGENFIMLRGDHESPIGWCYPQQFPEELMSKLHDENILHKVYEELFTQLPMAVVLNEKYFIVHGGIPVNSPSVKELKKLHKTARPIDLPEIFQMLWNDPSPNNGVSASERGDGIYFGRDIANNFLQKSGLEMIVRGHTHRLGGCELNGKTLTLLSTTAYSGDKQYIAKFDNGKLDIYDVSGPNPVPQDMMKLRI